MSPAKFNDEDHDSRKVINGPRPSLLKLNRDSHLIQKPSSSFAPVAVAPTEGFKPQQKREPVIIYTHSPKVIHTQARDFMALVQKLTGLTHPDQDKTTSSSSSSALEALEANTVKSGNNRNSIISHNQDDNEESSVVTDDTEAIIRSSSSGSGSGSGSGFGSMLSLSNPYFGDIPLFTPNGTDLFCSPRQAYRFPPPDTAFASPNMGGSISPSVLEFIKGIQEY